MRPAAGIVPTSYCVNVSVAVLLTPARLPVINTGVVAPTTVVVIGNATYFAPAGTTT